MTMETPPVATGMVIQALEGIRSEIHELSDRMESPAPGLFRCVALNRTHIRMRIRDWVLAATDDAADTITLLVGSSVVASVVVTPEVATLIVPLPITIERGTDVVAQAGNGTVIESFLIYYPE